MEKSQSSLPKRAKKTFCPFCILFSPLSNPLSHLNAQYPTTWQFLRLFLSFHILISLVSSTLVPFIIQVMLQGFLCTKAYMFARGGYQSLYEFTRIKQWQSWYHSSLTNIKHTG